MIAEVKDIVKDRRDRVNDTKRQDLRGAYTESDYVSKIKVQADEHEPDGDYSGQDQLNSHSHPAVFPGKKPVKQQYDYPHRFIRQIGQSNITVYFFAAVKIVDLCYVVVDEKDQQVTENTVHRRGYQSEKGVMDEITFHRQAICLCSVAKSHSF
jgi:hypothetical protein